MPRESVLSIADKEAIRIEKLIFHIILTDNVSPVFLEELEITTEQQKFFRDRLADAAQGRQYVFTEDNPPIQRLAKDMFTTSASDADFLEISKNITSRFKTAHTSNANNGVFIVSIASIRNRKLLFLIKLDHKKVYEYKLHDGNRALLSEIQNTFSEDKTAIQKVALIDVNSSVVWDVLVFDRSKPGGITDFFARFLSVVPRETEAILTKKAQTVARKWAAESKAIIDPNQEPAVYKNRAREYLINATVFDTDEYMNAVVQDDNDARRINLRNSFRQYLEDEGLAGQTFIPKREAITPKEIKNVRQTAEGVKLEWSGDPVDSNIDIPNVPNQNGQYVVTITTSDITEIQ
ncbi:nucleoid-associated protein [uncultured Bacteroides sp.]|uniref:nucleoid-associated protein n=1 Tax=uncultured Bacteroides sp. TaxID=162156 RepID=UPI002AA82EEA|nr:nucleoid-associated protein [uncultured Bacteroides sp.]